MTNFEEIKSMSAEEFADIITLLGGCSICNYYGTDFCNHLLCKNGIKEYLESEVKDGDSNENIL